MPRVYGSQVCSGQAAPRWSVCLIGLPKPRRSADGIPISRYWPTMYVNTWATRSVDEDMQPVDRDTAIAIIREMAANCLHSHARPPRTIIVVGDTFQRQCTDTGHPRAEMPTWTGPCIAMVRQCEIWTRASISDIADLCT